MTQWIEDRNRLWIKEVGTVVGRLRELPERGGKVVGRPSRRALGLGNGRTDVRVHVGMRMLLAQDLEELGA